MKIKRWISALLCMLLCVSMAPATAYAADEMDTWDGTEDVAWYTENPEATQYHITTAEQLAGLAKLVNEKTENFAGKTIYLENDLDLAGHEWTAIGERATQPTTPADLYSPFSGTFDGQGHEIKNITTTSKKPHSQLGLFGGVRNGTIANLKVTDAYIVNTDEMYVGLLSCQAYQSTIINCSTSGTLITSPLGLVYAGGLVGFSHNGTKIIGCYSSATIIDYVTEWTGNYIGGIVGAWDHTDDQDGWISDCYFNGQILFSEDSDPEVGKSGLTGGILGYHDLANSVNASGDVIIKNCMVTTSKIENAYTLTGEGNTPVWIMYNATSEIPQNCYWPDTSDDWPAAITDISSDPIISSDCGEAVQDFTDNSLLNKLTANADPMVTWVMGMEHPTLTWDEQHISADYTHVDAAIAKAEALNPENYTDFSAVEAAVDAVVRNKPIAAQAEVDAMAKAIEDAITALEYKKADYTAVDVVIKKANALHKDDYKDFSTVEAAIHAVVRDKNITEQAAVNEMAKAIEKAIADLAYKAADYTQVDAAIAKAEALNPENYTDFSAVEAAVNAVVHGKNITEQDEVDNMALAIEKAIAGLEKKSAVAPTDTDTPTKDQTGDTTSPKTSESSHIALWIVIMLMTGTVGITLYQSKRKYTR